MAPSFEQLDSEVDYDDGEDEIDFSGTASAISIVSPSPSLLT